MKYLKSVIIGCLIGYVFHRIGAIAQIAPQTPQQAQQLQELLCRKNANFIASLINQPVRPKLGDILDSVTDDYKPVLFFIYDHKLKPYETSWFTYGYCMKTSTAGKDKA